MMKSAMMSAYRLTLVLIIGGLVRTTSDAATIRYSTSGSTNDSSGLIQFENVQNGTFDPSAPLDLGRIHVTAPAPGTTVNLSGVHVYGTFSSPDYPDTVDYLPNPIPPGTPYNELKITQHVNTLGFDGILQGSISGDGQSSLKLTSLSVVPSGPFPTDQRVLVTDLPFQAINVKLAAPLTLSVGEGPSNDLVAQVVPEPSTLAFFAVAAMGLAARRFGRRRSA